MRARNIKPGFFKNEYLAKIHPLGRIVFIGLWCLADREGRLEDRPERIKAEILPYDKAEIDSILSNLDASKFIVRYAVNGEKYIQINNFTKHQNPHLKEQASAIPAHDPEIPVQAREIPAQAPYLHGTCPADSLIPDSLILNPETIEKNMCVLGTHDPLLDQAKEVILYLNEATGSRFRPNGKNVDQVQTRLKEGFTVEDCKQVIDGQKLDPYFLENPKYFRPSTLFGSKFEGYLSAAPKQRAALEKDPRKLIEEMRAEAENRRFIEGGGRRLLND